MTAATCEGEPGTTKTRREAARDVTGYVTLHPAIMDLIMAGTGLETRGKTTLKGCVRQAVYWAIWARSYGTHSINNANLECDPNLAQLMQATDLCKSVVVRAVQELVFLGVLDYTKGTQINPNTYRPRLYCEIPALRPPQETAREDASSSRHEPLKAASSSANRPLENSAVHFRSASSSRHEPLKAASGSPGEPKQQEAGKEAKRNNNNTVREGENSLVDVVDLLCKEGVTESVAQDLLQRKGAEAINLQLKYLKYRNAKRNKAGMLVSAIEQAWIAPDDYKPPRPLPATAAPADASVPASSMSAPLSAAESHTTAPGGTLDAPAAPSGVASTDATLKEMLSTAREALHKAAVKESYKPAASPTAQPSTPATRPQRPTAATDSVRRSRTDGLDLQPLGQSQEFKEFIGQRREYKTRELLSKRFMLAPARSQVETAATAAPR